MLFSGFWDFHNWEGSFLRAPAVLLWIILGFLHTDWFVFVLFTAHGGNPEQPQGCAGHSPFWSFVKIHLVRTVGCEKNIRSLPAGQCQRGERPLLKSTIIVSGKERKNNIPRNCGVRPQEMSSETAKFSYWIDKIVNERGSKILLKLTWSPFNHQA